MKSPEPASSPQANNQRAIAELKDRTDIGHPLVYADQISSISITAFTTKLTLSVEDHLRSERVPVTTLVMPTAAAHALAQVIIANIGNPDQQALMLQNFTDYQNSVKSSKS